MSEEIKKKPGRPPIIKIKPATTKDETVEEVQTKEKVNTGVSDSPLVDYKTEVPEGSATRKCRNHPEAKAVVYGMCLECFNKLTKVEKRKLFLKARLKGVNTHNYPKEMVRTWKRELVMIEAKLPWKGPLKIKKKAGLAEELIG